MLSRGIGSELWRNTVSIHISQGQEGRGCNIRLTNLGLTLNCSHSASIHGPFSSFRSPMGKHSDGNRSDEFKHMARVPQLLIVYVERACSILGIRFPCLKCGYYKERPYINALHSEYRAFQAPIALTREVSLALEAFHEGTSVLYGRSGPRRYETWSTILRVYCQDLETKLVHTLLAI